MLWYTEIRVLLSPNSVQESGVEWRWERRHAPAPAFATPARIARAIELHSAVESALLLCTMEPFCSPG